MTKINRLVPLFVINSFASVITLGYLHMIHTTPPLGDWVYVTMPYLYGIAGLINIWAIEYTNNINASILIGGLFGVLLSIIGRFWLDIPVKLLGYNKNNAHNVHIFAFGLYALIFRFVIGYLNNFFGFVKN